MRRDRSYPVWMASRLLLSLLFLPTLLIAQPDFAEPTIVADDDHFTVEIVGLKSYPPGQLWDSVVSLTGSASPYGCASFLQEEFGFYDVAALMTPREGGGFHSLVIVSEERPAGCETFVPGAHTNEPADSASLAAMESLYSFPFDVSKLLESHAAGASPRSVAEESKRDWQRYGQGKHRSVDSVAEAIADVFAFFDRSGLYDEEETLAAIRAARNDTVRAMRLLWVPALQDRQSAWNLVLSHLRDHNRIVRYNSLTLLAYLIREDSEKSIEYLDAAIGDVRCIVAGDNLFALFDLLNLFQQVDIPGKLAHDIVDGNSQLLDRLSRIQEKMVRESVVDLIKRARAVETEAGATGG